MGDAGIETSLFNKHTQGDLKTVRQRRCPVCSDAISCVLFSIEAFPYFTAPVARVAKEDILRNLSPSQRSAPLNVRACRSCCHCYLENLPDADILDFLYSRYYTYPSALKGHFQPSRDNRFLAFFDEIFVVG